MVLFFTVSTVRSLCLHSSTNSTRHQPYDLHATSLLFKHADDSIPLHKLQILPFNLPLSFAHSWIWNYLLLGSYGPYPHLTYNSICKTYQVPDLDCQLIQLILPYDNPNFEQSLRHLCATNPIYMPQGPYHPQT